MTLENSVWYCYISYEMTDQFLWFQVEMNSYSINWNTPYHKAELSQLVNFKNAIWTLEERYAIKFCFKLGKNAMWWKLDILLWPRDSSQWKHAGSPRPKKARQSKSTHKLLIIPFFDSTGMIYMHWVPTGQAVNKEYYVEVLREFRKRFRRKRPALFKSSQCHFHQSTTPSFSQTIWPRWASTQFLTLPIVQTLLPVTFAYSLSSEAVVMRQLRRWKRLWQRSLTRSHKRTSMGPSRNCSNGTSALQQEKITSKWTRVSCVYYQLKCPYEKVRKLIEGIWLLIESKRFQNALPPFFFPSKSTLQWGFSSLANDRIRFLLFLVVFQRSSNESQAIFSSE